MKKNSNKGATRMILDLLSNNEALVFRYLEQESKNGPIRQSIHTISKNILERFADQIPARKVKGEDREEKHFSEATVHRAMKKMEENGYLTVVPTAAKTEMNEILFHGEPEEEQIIEKIKEQATKIVHSVSRLQRTNKNLLDQIAEKESELQSIYQNHQALLQEREDFMANLKETMLVIPKEKIVSTKKNGETITIVIRN
jgi:hypothetical protein